MTTPAEDYQARLALLAAAAGSGLRDLYADLVPGLVEDAEPRRVEAFVGIGSRLLEIINRRAALLAEVASGLLLRPAAPARPLRLPAPAGEQQRLAGTLSRTLDGSAALLLPGPERLEAQRGRVEQVGRSEPLKASQAAMHEAMAARGAVGWVRVPNADACERCRTWADGKIRPSSVVMKIHFGCQCTAQPVLEGDPRDRTDKRERVIRKPRTRQRADAR